MYACNSDAMTVYITRVCVCFINLLRKLKAMRSVNQVNFLIIETFMERTEMQSVIDGADRINCLVWF